MRRHVLTVSASSVVLSRRVGRVINTPAVVELFPQGRYIPFIEEVKTARDFGQLPVWVGDVIQRGEAELAALSRTTARSAQSDGLFDWIVDANRVVDAFGNAHDSHGMFAAKGYVGTDGLSEDEVVSIADRLGGMPKLYLLKKQVGDPAMAAVSNTLGTAGRPRLVSKAEMDRLIAAGSPELWRGESHAAYAEQTKTGEVRYGLGGMGNGIYAAATWHDNNARARASGYAGSPDALMRMTLDPAAKVLDVDDGYEKKGAEENGWFKRKMDAAPDRNDADAYGRYADEAADQHRLLFSDLGRWAQMRGYDALNEGGRTYIILNRSALIVQREQP
jgi:hypothetical protein